ncbi:MAG: hypothetical protein U9N61_05375, partial [Euryarchaeota archaeon]|nr:hypothetical protein [Euryarchaeota archaeon]
VNPRTVILSRNNLEWTISDDVIPEQSISAMDVVKKLRWHFKVHERISISEGAIQVFNALGIMGLEGNFQSGSEVVRVKIVRPDFYLPNPRLVIEAIEGIPFWDIGFFGNTRTNTTKVTPSLFVQTEYPGLDMRGLLALIKKEALCTNS